MQNENFIDFLNLQSVAPVEEKNDLDVWLNATVGTSLSIDSIEGKDLPTEEVKKKRNTEASARFRQKKKERDEQLRRERDELKTQVTILHSRIQEQDKEIKWLRALVLEKNSQKETDIQDQISTILQNTVSRYLDSLNKS